MTTVRDLPRAVLILRAGYATEALWRAAIAQALTARLTVDVVDAIGRRRRLSRLEDLDAPPLA